MHDLSCKIVSCIVIGLIQYAKFIAIVNIFKPVPTCYQIMEIGVNYHHVESRYLDRFQSLMAHDSLLSSCSCNLQCRWPMIGWVVQVGGIDSENSMITCP